MTHAILVIPRSIGQLQVQTAHDRKYMIIVNFSTFMAGNKGQKKAPIHITAWLLLNRNRGDEILDLFFTKVQEHFQQFWIHHIPTNQLPNQNNTNASCIVELLLL